MEENKNNNLPDLSWMWHGSEKIMDYTTLDNIDPLIARACNRAATVGMRLTLNKLCDLGLIQMTDINRAKTKEDQKIFDENFDN